MIKKERIKSRMEKDPDIVKYLKEESYYCTADLYNSIITYIKATKERRMLCVINKVSASGMSRTMMFHSTEKNKSEHYTRNYYSLFKAYGHIFRGRSYHATISGCGMDMVWNTNYNMIHWFRKLGFISKKQCDRLSQQSPTCL